MESEPPSKPAPDTSTDSGHSRRRRWGVRGLVALGSIVLAVSVMALWIAREALARLAALRAQGALAHEEFEALKRPLLG